VDPRSAVSQPRCRLGWPTLDSGSVRGAESQRGEVSLLSSLQLLQPIHQAAKVSNSSRKHKALEIPLLKTNDTDFVCNMATGTTTPMPTSSPFHSMNPTMTEHDFRFPRRPNDDSPSFGASDAASPTNSKASADLRASLQELKLDISTTYATAHDELLRTETFPAFQPSADGGLGNIDELLKQDPLSTPVWSQVWKFYAQTKQLLPDQRRMENLTWRIMQMRLQKSRREQKIQYVIFHVLGFTFLVALAGFLPVSISSSPAPSFQVPSSRESLQDWSVRQLTTMLFPARRIRRL